MDETLEEYYAKAGMEGIGDNFFIPPIRRKISMVNFDRVAINKLRRTLRVKDMNVIHRWFRYNRNWDKIRPDIPELREVGQRIQACQKIRLPKDLYRGVARGNSYDWGVIRNGWIYNDIDPNKENKPFQVELERPMSFAMNLEKAKQFGSNGLFRYGVCVLILNTAGLRPSDYVPLTKEVLYLLDEFDKSGGAANRSQKREERRVTQESNDVYYDDDEIVVLPTNHPITLIAKKPKNVHQGVASWNSNTQYDLSEFAGLTRPNYKHVSECRVELFKDGSVKQLVLEDAGSFTRTTATFKEGECLIPDMKLGVLAYTKSQLGIEFDTLTIKQSKLEMDNLENDWEREENAAKPEEVEDRNVDEVSPQNDIGAGTASGADDSEGQDERTPVADPAIIEEEDDALPGEEALGWITDPIISSHISSMLATPYVEGQENFYVDAVKYVTQKILNFKRKVKTVVNKATDAKPTQFYFVKLALADRKSTKVKLTSVVLKETIPEHGGTVRVVAKLTNFNDREFDLKFGKKSIVDIEKAIQSSQYGKHEVIFHGDSLRTIAIIQKRAEKAGNEGYDLPKVPMVQGGAFTYYHATLDTDDSQGVVANKCLSIRGTTFTAAIREALDAVIMPCNIDCTKHVYLPDEIANKPILILYKYTLEKDKDYTLLGTDYCFLEVRWLQTPVAEDTRRYTLGEALTALNIGYSAPLPKVMEDRSRILDELTEYLLSLSDSDKLNAFKISTIKDDSLAERYKPAIDAFIYNNSSSVLLGEYLLTEETESRLNELIFALQSFIKENAIPGNIYVERAISSEGVDTKVGYITFCASPNF